MGEGLRRWRSMLAGACALVALALPAGPAAGAAPAGTSPVAVENALPGTTAGVLPSSATGGSVEGYASEVSALPGDTLHLHVSTVPAAPYRVEVYRLGWYGGAGSRLVGCTPSCATFRPGQALPHPDPDAEGLVRAGWPVTDSFTLPAGAASGYYRIRFVLPSGLASWTYVIVRAPPSAAPSPILVQVPVFTWQAYNSWGGRSLYQIAGTAARANRVSFDRPYDWLATGNQSPLGWEYPFVEFLEQAGYDVSYQTDLDTDADPGSLLGHRLVVVLGHDEYWTQTMRDAFDAARDRGVNLAFMGANDAYWRTRVEDGGHTLAVFKGGDDPVADPGLRTGLFRTVGQAECRLVGIQHQGGRLDWPAGDFVVTPAGAASPWLAGTGLAAGSVLHGLVGVETDTIPGWDGGASCGHDLTVLLHDERGGDQLGNADTTVYTAPSGAVVFAAGSKRLVWGLADPPAASARVHGLVDARLQRLVANLLDGLSARHVAGLGVRLALKAGSVRPGRPFRVVALIGNDGPDAAASAELDLTLPPNVAFVRVAATGLTCTPAPLRCRLAQLAPGASLTAVFTLRARTPGMLRLLARAYTMLAANPAPDRALGRIAIRCRPGAPGVQGTTTVPDASPPG